MTDPGSSPGVGSPRRALIPTHFAGEQENANPLNLKLALTARKGEAPTPLAPASVLRSHAKRCLVQPSAVKEMGGAQLSFAGALSHYSMFDKVTALEKENTNLKEEVRDLKQQLEDASERARIAEQAAANAVPAAPAELAELAAGDPAAMGKQQLLDLVASLQQELSTTQAERRRAHNQLVDLRGAVRVYCRVRPLPITAPPTTTVRLLPDACSLGVTCYGQESLFRFQRVFGPASTQQQVFGEVSELVQSALDGHHVCLMSYGQTGSGKTHNMVGQVAVPEGQGLIPRSVDKILSTVQRLKLQGWEYTLEASCMELYNNGLRDLLDPSVKVVNDMNAIKHDQNGGSHTVVSGVSTSVLSSTAQAMSLLQRAAASRASNATAMNTQSSRSHQVFMLNITGTHAASGARLTGALCLVDLAGSERLDRSRAEGQRKAEACAINQTLSSLGDVFDALNSNAKHIPYRNTKLTYLLKPCLSAGGKTLLMVHVTPEDASAYETITTLRFATKVAGTELGAPARKAITYVGAPELAATVVPTTCIGQVPAAQSLPAAAPTQSVSKRAAPGSAATSVRSTARRPATATAAATPATGGGAAMLFGQEGPGTARNLRYGEEGAGMWQSMDTLPGSSAAPQMPTVAEEALDLRAAMRRKRTLQEGPAAPGGERRIKQQKKGGDGAWY